MTSHLSDEQIQRYRRRLLSGSELLAASSHIAQCQACRTSVASPADVHRSVAAIRHAVEAALPHADHLVFEDLVALVDGELALEDAARVDAHLRECEACAADARELQMLRRELRKPQNLEFGIWNLEFWKGLRPRVLVPALAVAGLVLIAVLRAPAVRRQGEQARSTAAVSPPAAGTSTPSNVATTVLRDGDRTVTVSADGTVTGLDALPDAIRATLTHALAAQRIDRPRELADLVARRGVLLGRSGATSSLAPVKPIGTVVESDRPLFSWTSGGAGAEYRVTVYDEGFNEAATSDWTRRLEWQPADGLRRGARYSWQITVRLNGEERIAPVPPAPEARFRVLGAAEQTALAAGRTAAGTSHLVLGVLYARDGLLDQAEAELSALAAANPGSPAAAALLTSVKAMR